MNLLILAILVAASVGSGMMAGLFCSFSSFVIKALTGIPRPQGIAAMQSINVHIVRPVFLFVFFGTGVACALALVLGWQHFEDSARTFAALGGATYILGCVVVTALFNVPLNNRLAGVDPQSEEGMRMWEFYLKTWTRWNHVRSVATIASTVLLVIAVYLTNRAA